MPEKYWPTQEDITRAESAMTSKQKEQSESREADSKFLDQLDPETRQLGMDLISALTEGKSWNPFPRITDKGAIDVTKAIGYETKESHKTQAVIWLFIHDVIKACIAYQGEETGKSAEEIRTDLRNAINNLDDNCFDDPTLVTRGITRERALEQIG